MSVAEQNRAASVARPEPDGISPAAPACRTNKAVCVRFSPAEYERLAAVAAERHLSIPEVLRLSWTLIEHLETSHV